MSLGAESGRTGRIRRLYGRSRALLRLVYRDPENVSERLALRAIQQLGEPTREWAQATLVRHEPAAPSKLAEEVRRHTATVARIDGAVAGTPFLIALAPGYLGYLWLEAQMVFRIAALFGRDPRQLDAAAELLALRGVHPDVASARAALEAVLARPLPTKPQARRPLRTWINSVRAVLVLGGFMSPKQGCTDGWRARLMVLGGLLAAGALWVITWVFPITFMIAMAWTCERDARQLGRRARAYYGSETTDGEAALALARGWRDVPHRPGEIARAALLFASIAIPIAFIAYADHVRNTTGVSWVGGLGALVALSLVIATMVVAKSK
jgi:hypothetical protein